MHDSESDRRRDGRGTSADGSSANRTRFERGRLALVTSNCINNRFAAASNAAAAAAVATANSDDDLMTFDDADKESRESIIDLLNKRQHLQTMASLEKKKAALLQNQNADEMTSAFATTRDRLSAGTEQQISPRMSGAKPKTVVLPSSDLSSTPASVSLKPNIASRRNTTLVGLESTLAGREEEVFRRLCKKEREDDDEEEYHRSMSRWPPRSLAGQTRLTNDDREVDERDDLFDPCHQWQESGYRRKRNSEEGFYEDDGGIVVKKRQQKKSNNKYEELDESGDDDDPNSSLALLDEPQQSSAANHFRKDEEEDDEDDHQYLTQFNGHFQLPGTGRSERNISDVEISKLQQNTSQLQEAKTELEALRKMLRCGILSSSQNEVSSYEPSKIQDQSTTKPKKPTTRSAKGGRSDEETNDPGLLEKLNVLKVAQDKLLRFQQVLGDIKQQVPSALSSNVPFPGSSASGDRTLSSSGNNQSAITKKKVSVGVGTTTKSGQKGRPVRLDTTRERTNAEDLDRLLQLVSDEISSAYNEASSVQPTRSWQSTANDGVFIRNSLPESTSVRTPSQCPNTDGGTETSERVAARTASKRSSETDMSMLSRVPCASRSTDCLPTNIECQIFNSSERLNNNRKPEKTRDSFLDPQLLSSLNQSFQQLIADNRRLSDRFNQLRDFVLRQSQCLFTTSDNMTNMMQTDDDNDCHDGSPCHEADEFHLRHDTVNRRSQGGRHEPWTEQGCSPLADRCGLGREAMDRCGSGRSSKVHSDGSGHLLAYLAKAEKSDVGDDASSDSKRVFDGRRGPLGDCFDSNMNGNNVASAATKKMRRDDADVVAATTAAADDDDAALSVNQRRPEIHNSIDAVSASFDANRFDRLKESVYSEVALFISKNEARPYFLLELIRRLQKIETDTHRRQAMLAFDNISSGYLTEEELLNRTPTVLRIDGQTKRHAEEVQPPPRDDEKDADGDFETDSCATSVSQNDEEEECGSTCYYTDLDGKEEREAGEGGGGGTEADDGDARSSTCYSLDPDCIDDVDYLKSDAEEEDEDDLENDYEREEGEMSSEEDAGYSPDPDHKSQTSSSQDELDVKEPSSLPLATGPLPPPATRDVFESIDLDVMAEQMGFVTVEFVNDTQRMNAADSEKASSSVSDGSWEKADFVEKESGNDQNGSDNSSEIVEEITAEPGSSSDSIEELTLEELQLRLTSIPKAEIDDRMATEYQGELSAELLLQTTDLGADGGVELAGDGEAARQPDASGFDKQDSRHV